MAGLVGGGLAVDLAGGDGSGALWLGRQGLSPVLVEVSDVAISLAEERAAANGVDLVTRQMDLEGETIGSMLVALGDPPSVSSLDGEPLTVITCLHYLNRGLLASVAQDLPPGVTFMASIATVTNLERHDRPSARFLVKPGELRHLIIGNGERDGVGERGGASVRNRPSDLTEVHYFEGWNNGGTHEAEIIVRRSRHLSDRPVEPMHKHRLQR